VKEHIISGVGETSWWITMWIGSGHW